MGLSVDQSPYANSVTPVKKARVSPLPSPFYYLLFWNSTRGVIFKRENGKIKRTLHLKINDSHGFYCG